MLFENLIRKGNKTMKQNCNWYKCSEHDEYHEMKDFCGTCAPFWDEFPICPVDNQKLNKTGYCNKCIKFYKVEEKIIS